MAVEARDTLGTDAGSGLGMFFVGPGFAGRSGSAVALPLSDAVDQSCSPALADIIVARRVRTVAMISSGSIPWR